MSGWMMATVFVLVTLQLHIEAQALVTGIGSYGSYDTDTGISDKGNNQDYGSFTDTNSGSYGSQPGEDCEAEAKRAEKAAYASRVALKAAKDAEKEFREAHEQALKAQKLNDWETEKRARLEALEMKRKEKQAKVEKKKVMDGLIDSCSYEDCDRWVNLQVFCDKRALIDDLGHVEADVWFATKGNLDPADIEWNSQDRSTPFATMEENLIAIHASHSTATRIKSGFDLGDGLLVSAWLEHGGWCHLQMKGITAEPINLAPIKGSHWTVQHKTEPVSEACTKTGCPIAWPGDGYCDEVCDSEECNFDGWDCSDTADLDDIESEAKEYGSAIEDVGSYDISQEEEEEEEEEGDVMDNDGPLHLARHSEQAAKKAEWEAERKARWEDKVVKAADKSLKQEEKDAREAAKHAKKKTNNAKRALKIAKQDEQKARKEAKQALKQTKNAKRLSDKLAKKLAWMEENKEQGSYGSYVKLAEMLAGMEDIQEQGSYGSYGKLAKMLAGMKENIKQGAYGSDSRGSSDSSDSSGGSYSSYDEETADYPKITDGSYHGYSEEEEEEIDRSAGAGLEKRAKQAAAELKKRTTLAAKKLKIRARQAAMEAEWETERKAKWDYAAAKAAEKSAEQESKDATHSVILAQREVKRANAVLNAGTHVEKDADDSTQSLAHAKAAVKEAHDAHMQSDDALVAARAAALAGQAAVVAAKEDEKAIEMRDKEARAIEKKENKAMKQAEEKHQKLVKQIAEEAQEADKWEALVDPRKQDMTLVDPQPLGSDTGGLDLRHLTPETGDWEALGPTLKGMKQSPLDAADKFLRTNGQNWIGPKAMQRTIENGKVVCNECCPKSPSGCEEGTTPQLQYIPPNDETNSGCGCCRWNCFSDPQGFPYHNVHDFRLVSERSGKVEGATEIPSAAQSLGVARFTAAVITVFACASVF